jgi:hypothetical protein
MVAIQWVLQKIGAAFEKVVEWLGFIFAWGDILETSDQITKMVDGMLTFGSNFFTLGGIMVEVFFDNMIKSLDQSSTISETVKSQVTDPYAHDKQGDGKTRPALDSAPANWSNVSLCLLSCSVIV